MGEKSATFALRNDGREVDRLELKRLLDCFANCGIINAFAL